MTATLELRNLSRSYGATRALDDVTLTVGAGEIFGYLGPNGAGKTTTIKIVTGLVPPTSGDALVCGHSITTDPLSAKSRVGYVPESGALFEKLTPEEHLDVSGRLHGLQGADLAERIERWLSEFGLADRRRQPIQALSKGLKQRVCWAAALLHDPEVLVLDEPLNGLDVEMVTHAKHLLSTLAAQGRCIFYSSHLVDVVEKLSTRLGVVYAGRLIATGSVAEVLALAGADTLEQALPLLWRRAA